MDEQKTTEEVTTEPAPEGSGEGDKPETNKLVDDTNLAAKRLEEATKAAKEERLAAEESYAKMKLGGQTPGQPIVEKKEETPKEYHERVKSDLAAGKYDRGQGN